MSNFPLYDNLIKEVKNEDLTTKEKETLVKNIKSIDDNGNELLYVLIKVYQFNNEYETTTYCTIPYDGKFVKKDIKFDLEKLPNKLKQIINKFVIMHMETISKDK
jgi:hypothetical protein